MRVHVQNLRLSPWLSVIFTKSWFTKKKTMKSRGLAGWKKHQTIVKKWWLNPQMGMVQSKYGAPWLRKIVNRWIEWGTLFSDKPIYGWNNIFFFIEMMIFTISNHSNSGVIVIYDHNQSIRLLINMHLKTRILINFAHVNLLNQQNHHFYAMFTIPKFGRFMTARVSHLESG